MVDKAHDEEDFDRLGMFLKFMGLPKDLPPKAPTPPPQPSPQVAVEEQFEDSDDEQPPPVPIDPNWKPIFARDLVKKVQPKPPSPMATDPLNFAFDIRKGQPAPLGFSFVPFIAVTKYCYKFVPKKLMQPLASAFFDAEKIWNREWDLYYISSSYGGVVTFISDHQLRALLDEINEAFPEAKLEITDEDRDGGLVIDFDDLEQRFRPRFLGLCNSRSKHAAWVQQLETEPQMAISDSNDRNLEAFKAKVEAALAISKNKTKAGRAKKLQENVLKRHDMVQQTLRCQRFLGLLAKKEESLIPDISNLSISAPLDPSKPAPHPLDSEPIFISIDVEAYEKPPRMITEVGVATLDTRDLKNTAPGKNAQDWYRFIRGRHFRISEYKHLVNHEYVQGCPDSFEFGESESVAQNSIASVLASCFREPFSKPSSNGEDHSAETRNIVLVGHDLGQDINYCQQMGYNVLNRGNILDTADTANMYRSYTKDPNARSLGSILYDFDISGWHLHNAGNDAAYTLQAMLAICVQSAAGRGEEEEKRERETQQKREETLIEGAKEKAREDAQGWASNGEDGGVPVKPQLEDFIKLPKPGKPTYGPPRPPQGLYTMGGAPLDV